MTPPDPYSRGTWFGALADFVGERYLDFDYTKGTDQEVRFLQEALELGPGSRVLDVACGLGRHALPLARDYGCRVTGFDLSGRLVHIARERAQGLTASFAQADARAFPFRDGSFDAAFSVCEGAFGLLGDMRPFATPEEVGDWDYREFLRESDREHVKLLTEVYRVLRPGGLVLVSALHSLQLRQDPNFDPATCVVADLNKVHSPEGLKGEFMVPVRCFTAREISTLMDQAELRVLAVMGGTSGEYGTLPLTVDDPEVLVLAERPG
ncbi:MAG TPA: class I SAM-dependent methyltransferase [Candidatus Thermoplasmatota archaeon]|nr:class I SAM-dependent methyltransferase [Candidatus Thermoplasmatota archaeon]